MIVETTVQEGETPSVIAERLVERATSEGGVLVTEPLFETLVLQADTDGMWRTHERWFAVADVPTAQDAPDAGQGVEGDVPTTDVPESHEESNVSNSTSHSTETGVEIRTNDESGEHAVATAAPMEVDGDRYIDVWVDEPLTADAARLLAAHLLRLANAQQ